MRAFGVDVEVAVGEPLEAPGRRVVDLRHGDGTPVLAVDRREDGWLLRAPGHGTHLVAADGRSVTVGADDPWPDRLLVAQSLPTAAALQGRDLFHASAVSTAAGVLALSGPSGSGKSTLADGLVRRGCGSPFTADVLAVGVAGGELVAYPGPVIDDDPRSVPTPAVAAVASLVLLDRVAGPARLAVAEHDAPALMRELLAAAFVPHVSPPERLVARLDVCGLLLAQRRAHRLVVPTSATVEATLDLLEARVRPNGTWVPRPPAG